MPTPFTGLPLTPDDVKISQLAAADRALAAAVDAILGGKLTEELTDAAEDAAAAAVDANPRIAELIAKLATGLYHVRALVADEDVNEIKAPGVYSVTSAAIAATLTNMPEAVPGSLVVAGPASGIRTQTFIPHTGGMFVHAISTADGKFGPWQQLDVRGRPIPAGSNIETFRILGPWYVANTAAANTMTNRPPIPAAPAQMTNLTSNGQNTTLRLWYDMIGNGVWYQSINPATSEWLDWERLGGGGGGGATRDAGAGHLVHVQRERQGNGGPIGTGGLPVFALRIDHNMVNTVTKLLPMLRARALPASMCHFVNQFTPAPDYTGDNSAGYGWADVQSLALNYGIEAWGHSWTHKEAGGSQLEKEILGSRAELERLMPKLRIKGMMVPGTSGSFWGGFTNNLSDPSVWHNTEAGRLIMSAYAYANGGGGVLNPLAAGQTVGWQSYAVDTAATSAAAISVLKRAQHARAGAVIMIHPNMIDAPGGISSGVLAEILDYMAAERDAGRALVLTISGLLNADPERATRHNLIRDPGFSDGFTYWNAAGWTAANGVATTAGTGTLSQAVSLADHNYAAGSARELCMEVRATAGAVVKMRAADSATAANFDASETFTLPASANWVTVRKPVGIPAAGTAALILGFSRVSGGSVEIRKPGLLAL